MNKRKVVCSYWRCKWHGPEDEALSAPDPFNEGDVMIACPKCRRQTIVQACYLEGCWEEATGGAPTDSGYVFSCHEHYPKLTES